MAYDNKPMSGLVPKKRVDGARLKFRLVSDLKNIPIQISFLGWRPKFFRTRKEVRHMRKLYLKVKVFFKSGIDRINAFWKRYRNAILRLAGRFVIFLCKTIIEKFLDSRF